MARRRLNPFDHRQVMQRDDFEIFHYINPATCSCPPHQHDFFELFCLMKDNLDYIVEGLRYAMGPGSLILIPPGRMHRADVPGPTRDIDRFVLWMSVDFVRSVTEALPRAGGLVSRDLTGRNLIQPDEETGALMRRLLFALHREAAMDDPDSPQLCRALAAQLLAYSARSIDRAPDAVPPRAELRYHEIMRVYEYIVDNLQDSGLSVGTLAERFFMDKNTLTRQFKRQVGMTPGECIRRHRLEAARRLIHQGAPAQHACAECGFADYSAFYRAFRQTYDVTPSAYADQSLADRERAAANDRRPM